MPRIKVLNEDELNYWGDRFVEHGLHRYVPFFVFMRDPEQYWEEILGGEHRPLLPVQEGVAANINAGEYDVLDKACDGVETAIKQVEQSLTNLGTNNGRYYERLKHHRVAG